MLLIEHPAFGSERRALVKHEELDVKKRKCEPVTLCAPSSFRANLPVLPNKGCRVTLGATGRGGWHVQAWMIDTVEIDQQGSPVLGVDEDVATGEVPMGTA